MNGLNKNNLRHYACILREGRSFLSVEDFSSIRFSLEYLGKKLDDSISNADSCRDRVFAIAKIIAAEQNLDVHAIITGILFEADKFLDLDIEEIRELFGQETVDMLAVLQKIDALQINKETMKSDNFIDLLLSLSKDARLVLIRLAERLNKLRFIDVDQKEELESIAYEVYHLYAPIAHRLGLYNIKTEFEETGMKYLNTSMYRDIAKKLAATRSDRDSYIKSFIKPVTKALEKEGIQCRVFGRPKTIHSIWKKMVKQQVDFEEVYDLFAIRVIIQNPGKNEKASCWQAYSVITDIYQPNPKRLRDWISTPKTSGYESLHTTVVGPDGRWVEIQIRTERMDEIAEKGHAAHWVYKSGKGKSDEIAWMANLRKALEDPMQQSRSKSLKAKLDLYSKDVFIFTPQGDLKRLNQGATVLDFAFSIHTDVGSHCTGAKVNKRVVPIRYALKNGDQVEIITNQNQKPKEDWLQYVVTNRAKARIKRVLKEQQYENVQWGRELLERKLSHWKINYDENALHKLVNHFKLKSPLDLYQMIAEGNFDLQKIKDYFQKKQEVDFNRDAADSVPKTVEDFEKKSAQYGDEVLYIAKVGNLDYKLAKCCNPIFGDKVFGFITVSEGTKIHRMNCPNAKMLRARYPYRIVSVKWVEGIEKSSYPANIRITAYDELGIVNEISKVISTDMQVHMRSMNVKTSDKLIEARIIVMIQDKVQLDRLIQKIQKIKGILSVERSDNFKVK